MTSNAPVHRSHWPLVIGVVALAFLALVAWAVSGTFRLAEEAGRGVADMGADVVQIAERFRTGTITQTFNAALPDLVSTGAGNLEVATATVTEFFRRSDERRVLWDWVSLGETVAEIRVPVTYRYHLRLDDPWELRVSDQTCVVYAPSLRPSLPPAIDTSGMEKRTEAGWLRFDAAQKLAELERSVTPTLAEYAADPKHMRLARGEARTTIAAFVRSWLLREDHWREDRFRAVVVVFPDERGQPELIPPVVELGGS